MTDSTWTDSTGNNKASDPANWSSGSAPQPGDALILPVGSTIDIWDNDLQGDPLRIFSLGLGEPTNVHLSHHADAILGLAMKQMLLRSKG